MIISKNIRFILIGLETLCMASNSSGQTDTSSYSQKKKDSVLVQLYSASGSEVEYDLENQGVSSLLMANKDVFTQFATFQFGAGRYRIRGLAAENQLVLFNGVNINNLETGFSTWNNWGGLNDVTRFAESQFGIRACRFGFSGPGGYIHIDSKASSFKKGTRISSANGNRVFGQRFMLTHSTGMLKNNWAVTMSASLRNGEQVYLPGTYFGAGAFYASIDKQINEKHLLSLTGFVSPVEQGRSSAETLEAYNLAGTHYYNSLWGFQNGKVRNSSVSTFARPTLILTHTFKKNAHTQLTTILFYNFGKSTATALNWNNAPNPRPDYYKYLPSYQYQQGDTVQGDILKNNWLNDPANTQQINWDKLIAMNQANLYTMPNQVNQTINTTETRARYILERRVENLSNIGMNVNYNKRIKKLFISAGLNANSQKTEKYKEMEDLLGASYWLDVDQFAENLGVDEFYQQNNIDTPNRKVKQGEKFGYDYSIHINRAECWSQAEYSLDKFDMYGGICISGSQIWREGFVANGKFPTRSKGLSEKLNFLNYGFKSGVTYKLNGRNFLTMNANYFTRSPEASNVFISPSARNDLVNGVQSEKIISGDINYYIKFPALNFRATYYNTQINNQTWLRTFWSDEFNNNVNYIMTNVNENHQGIEIGIEKTIFVSHTFQGAFGYGENLYKNKPLAQAWQNNNNASLFTDRIVYLNNYRIGNGPQCVAGIGYRYTGKKNWFAGVTFNYFDQIYMDPNPDRRTRDALRKYVAEDPHIKEITQQEKLPAYCMMNMNTGKSFRLMKKYLLNINLSINNLLNHKNALISGYEQLRWDQSNIHKFQNKYYYMPGTTYMAVLAFNF